ncbi:MAG TPA: DUF2152 domain-containing protein [Candidatus Anaerobiospirillum stercoravium]|nr:DUF2152 domain-containing protein [Candidatus Anaerobiospirillum stercoravium]
MPFLFWLSIFGLVVIFGTLIYILVSTIGLGLGKR